MDTKIQRQREARYRQALKSSGFRSWKLVNARRDALIEKSVCGLSWEENRELERLQNIAGLYKKWKTNDETGRCLRRLKRMMK